VSTHANLAASSLASFVGGFVAGWLAARPSVSRLRRCLRAAAYAATHDRLTGLPNRDLVRQEFSRRRRRGDTVTVVLLDLDNFKQVNDRYGHHVGDAVLRHVAHRINAAARARGGLAARLGGDEFLLIDTGTGGHAGVLSRLAEPFTVEVTDGNGAGAGAGVRGLPAQRRRRHLPTAPRRLLRRPAVRRHRALPRQTAARLVRHLPADDDHAYRGRPPPRTRQ
jgi:GGDEF domain-containing protein